MLVAKTVFLAFSELTSTCCMRKSTPNLHVMSESQMEANTELGGDMCETETRKKVERQLSGSMFNCAAMSLRKDRVNIHHPGSYL